MLVVKRIEDHIVDLLSENRDARWTIYEMEWSEINQEYLPEEPVSENELKSGEIYWLESREHDSYVWVNEYGEPVMLMEHHHLMNEKEMDMVIHTMLTQGSDMESILEFVAL